MTEHAHSCVLISCFPCNFTFSAINQIAPFLSVKQKPCSYLWENSFRKLHHAIKDSLNFATWTVSFFVKIFLFIWLHWVFVAAHQLSLVGARGDYSSFRCTGFSLWWVLLLQSTDSECTGFSGCSMWAQELWHTGLVPPRRMGSSQTRTEPVSSALAGRFLTIGPPGKSNNFFFYPLVLLREYWQVKIEYPCILWNDYYLM